MIDEARKRLYKRVARDPYLSSGKEQTIENILWGMLPEDAPQKVLRFMRAVNESGEEIKSKPVLHITGVAGSGKSHLARAVALALVVNVWGTNFNLIGRGEFSYIDYPLYLSQIMSGEKGTEWNSPLMVIEGLDSKPPIPKSGDTYWLDKFMLMIKPRLRLGLPTIIVTRRNGSSLSKFLSMNSYGTVASTSSSMLAGDVVSLIKLHTMEEITLTMNVLRLITGDADIEREFRKKVSRQDIREYGFKNSIVWGLPDGK